METKLGYKEPCLSEEMSGERMNDIVVSRIEKSYISMVLGHEGPGNLLSSPI